MIDRAMQIVSWGITLSTSGLASAAVAALTLVAKEFGITAPAHAAIAISLGPLHIRCAASLADSPARRSACDRAAIVIPERMTTHG